MPVSVQKTNGKYRVSTPNGVKAHGTTKKNAERQARLLRAIDHGWHPTDEAVCAQAQRVVDRLLEYDFTPDSPRPGSKEDPWRQTTGPLGKMKFLKKRPALKPGPAKKPELKPKFDRFKWKPGETALEALLSEVDQIDSVPIPASAKRYARLSGMRGLRSKQQNYINMCRDLGNRGKSTKGFPNHDGADYTARKEGLERHHTEPTRFYGGRYGKGVPSDGKTGGKFKMPGNWKVGHAIKT